MRQEISQSSASVEPLLNVLGKKVIPWAEQFKMQRVVVALPDVRESIVPEGVRVSRTRLRGRKVAPRGPRYFGNLSVVTGHWPDDGLETTRTPTLACAVRGDIGFQAGEYVLHCKEGYFVLCPPGTPHPSGKRSHLDEPHEEADSADVLWLQRLGDGIHCHICHSRGSKHQPARAGESCYVPHHRLAQLLDLLVEEAVANEEGYEASCSGLLLTFLTILRRELGEGRIYPAGFSPSEERFRIEGEDPIRQAQQYMRVHLRENLTIEKVARLTSMSRTKFMKCFRQQTGKSFVEMLSEYRIEEAKNLLQGTDWSVYMVSEFVGFRSPSYFHRFFRRYAGMSPEEFRRRSRRIETSKPKVKT